MKSFVSCGLSQPRHNRSTSARARRGWLAASFAAVAALAGLSAPARGDGITLFYNFDGTGTWEDGGNWTSGSTPGPTDSAFIESGFAAICSTPNNTCNELQVGVGPNAYGNVGNPGGTGVLTLVSGATITASGNLVVGQAQDPSVNSSGTLNVGPGSNLNIMGGNSLVGFFGQSITDATVGTINVTGGTFNWNAGNNNATMWVGGESITPHKGQGVLNLSAGTMSGAALRVGDFGTGTFNMSGGTFNSNFYVSVGLGNNPNEGSGTVVMTGGTMNLAQLTLNEAKLAECDFNQSGGTINVGNVGQIDGYNFRIGYSRIGKGTYNMTGGVLNVAGNDLWVGAGIAGEMNISGDSAITVNYIPVDRTNSDYGFAIGGYDNGVSTVNQNGGSVTVLPTSLLGIFYKASNGGTSTYNLNAGTLTLGGISSDEGSTAKIFNFNGGTLVANKDMTVPNPARVAVPAGFGTTISAGGAKIDTGGFTVTWATPLTGAGSLTKQGAGTLVLTAANTYAGPTTVSGGQLQVAPGSLPANHALTVNNGASAQITPTYDGAPIGATIASLTLNGSGTLDLTDNDVIFRSGNEATIRSLIHSGALNSSVAGTGSGRDALATLGAITNSDGAGDSLYPTFDGVASSATDVLVKYTYLGDTDLNGYVDGSDLANLLAGMHGGLTGWANGDTNYDGVVNQADLDNLLRSLAGQGAPFGSGSGGGTGAVPEPTSLALLAPALLALRRARRS